MDRETIITAISSMEKLNYIDKASVYSRFFTTGYLASKDMNEKLVLISLLALTTSKMREKDPTMNPLKILMSITNQIEDNSVFYQFLEGIAIITEDFMYGCTKFDPCGLTSSREIINRIKEILGTWLPF